MRERIEQKLTMIYWKSDQLWLGRLRKSPDIMTQGRTLKVLEENMILKQALEDKSTKFSKGLTSLTAEIAMPNPRDATAARFTADGRNSLSAVMAQAGVEPRNVALGTAHTTTAKSRLRLPPRHHLDVAARSLRVPVSRLAEVCFGGSIRSLMKLMALWSCLGAFAITCGAAESSPAGRFESLGIPVRKGGLMGCLVGPNGRGGEALYFNLNQTAAPLFLVQVDPDTGQARQFTAPQGPGAWAFIVGPDGKVYFGTWSGALILRFDPKQPDKGIEVVGKPSASEDYLWQFALGADGQLYACTYPNAKLVRYDPATGRMDDLGRMHPTEMYARSLAVGPNGKVYVGLGTEKGDLVVFDPATGQHRSILPEGLKGAKGWSTVGVSRRADGQVYAEFGPNLMRIDDEKVTLVQTGPERPALKLRDGREVTAYGRGTFALKHPDTGKVLERTFDYSGAGDLIFVVGMGPGGGIYGSTAMPLEVFRFDPRTRQSAHLGGMPGGEVYSMLEHEQKLYFCYYGGAVMNLYDPAKPHWKFGSAADCNPISFGGVGDGHLRPRAMIRGPGGLIFIG
ncbi:MAG: hypothetical protein HY674_09005, partial [Chloroflexi bacterium]|nr:hypothetical protein [Chloroflexota bacterium]